MILDKMNSLYEESWQLLETAASQRDAGLRNITVAHQVENMVNAYTVVLRAVSTDNKTVIFFTDYRSPKVKQLQGNPAVTLCGYDDKLKTQIVLQGQATIHHEDDTTQYYWDSEGNKSPQSYGAQPAPSTIVEQESNGLKNFEAENKQASYTNFAVVEITVQQLEYLKLSREGNRRAQFMIDINGSYQGNWLIP